MQSNIRNFALQNDVQDIELIRRAFDQTCDELSIEPHTLTLAKRDQLVKATLLRLDEITDVTAQVSTGDWRKLPIAARVA